MLSSLRRATSTRCRPRRRSVALVMIAVLGIGAPMLAGAAAPYSSDPLDEAVPALAQPVTVANASALAPSMNNAFAALSQAIDDRRRIDHARAARAARADRAKKRQAQAAAADRDRRKRIAARLARAKAWTTPTRSGRVTTGFGVGGSQWSSGRHTGCDFDANTGDAVRAVHTGTILFAGSDGRYGNHVKIAHSNGDVTWYAHLSRITVSVGRQVTTGDTIGRAGQTGNAFGPHMHFEVHRAGSDDASNPVNYLRARGVRV